MNNVKDKYYKRLMMEAEVLLAPFTPTAQQEEFAGYYMKKLTEARSYYEEKEKRFGLHRVEAILKRLNKVINK